MNKLYKNIFSGLFLVFFVYACKDKENFAPELPKISTFKMEFSNFPNNEKTIKNTTFNWEYAHSIVDAWDSLVSENMEIPFAAYNEALSNHNQIYQGDNIWLWEYTFDNGDSEYTAKLFGEFKERSTFWEMFISKDGEFNDFKWFEGENFNDDSVNWIVYNNSKVVGDFLSINYSKSGLKYTNILDNNTQNGSYIIYGEGVDNNFDKFFTIYNNGKNNLIQIEWSSTYKNGRINDESYFQNLDWHCWNENLEDLDCK